MISAPKMEPPTANIQLTQAHAQSTPAVADLSLFGDVLVAIDTKEAPETNLSMILHGVLSLGGKGKGSAIISVDGRKDMIYRVGEPLPGGIILEHVYPDRVIISHDGRVETLYLPHHLSSEPF